MENLNKKQKIIFIGMFVIMITTIIYYFMQQNTETELEITENIEDIENINTEEIIVHITGCVEQEGIVKLKEGARIADAIEQAGGVTSDADMKKINLAYKLKDGQKIYIPSNIEEEAVTITHGVGVVVEEQQQEEKININTATQTELETLSGIGPSTALKIIQYREENGYFSDIEDIKDVPGIGESKFEAIKDSICVE